MEESQKKIIQEETDRILNDGKVLATSEQEKLNNIVSELNQLHSIKDVNDQAELDRLFEQGKNLLQSYGRTLGSFKYNLTITNNEFRFIKKQVMEKITYGRQDVFVGKKVRDNFIQVTDVNKYVDGQHTYQLKIEEITWLSYLMGKVEIDGLHDADNFANVVEKVGEVSRVFEVFQEKGTNISEEFHNWLQGVEEEEEVPMSVNTDEVPECEVPECEASESSEEKVLVSKNKQEKE